MQHRLPTGPRSRIAEHAEANFFWKPLIGARLQAILEEVLRLVRSTCLDFW